LFKAASYLIDVYRRDSPGCREPLDLLVYIGFFPQLLSGPIDRATTFLPQLRQARAFDYSLAVDGTRQILWGLFKKLALADGLATLTGQISASYATAQGPDLGLGAVLFSLQIYCDLSGYTDMATGLAKLLGIRTMRNFAYPYFSQNVAEFWRRWNISVSSWFRDYVYIPLGGSRVSRFRLIINILLTFVLSGLWHGANVTFLAWGAMLGVAVLFTSLRRKHVLKATDTPGGDRRSLASLAKILVTFSYISLSWIFFQSASMGQALGIFRRLFTPTIDPGAWLVPLRRLESMGVLAGVLLVFIIIEWLQRRRECPLDLGRWPRWVRWLAYTFTFWTMASLYNPGLSGDFLYYRF
jgi:D-alanyl-lipoteichoic acid acyltransferase DltB (MBOAT superfamily)